jgi:signal recognition particle GTPase
MTEEKRPEGDIMGELKLLGEQLATAVKALWESEESKNLRREIADGIHEAGRQIDTAFKSAQESEAAKDLSSTVRDTVEKARESDVAVKIQEGLVAGLRELNAQLDRVLKSSEVHEAAEPPAPPPPPPPDVETEA